MDKTGSTANHRGLGVVVVLMGAAVFVVSLAALSNVPTTGHLRACLAPAVPIGLIISLVGFAIAWSPTR